MGKLISFIAMADTARRARSEGKTVALIGGHYDLLGWFPML